MSQWILFISIVISQALLAESAIAQATGGSGGGDRPSPMTLVQDPSVSIVCPFEGHERVFTFRTQEGRIVYQSRVCRNGRYFTENQFYGPSLAKPTKCREGDRITLAVTNREGVFVDVEHRCRAGRWLPQNSTN